MKEITLKQLAPYLPYEVKGQLTGYPNGTTVTLGTVMSNKDKIWQIDMWLNGQVKPILRPLSDLTIDIIRQLISFDIVDFRMSNEIEDDFSIDVNDEMVGWTSLSYQEYQNIIAYHFDIFKLIPQGLAVDINTLSVE